MEQPEVVAALSQVAPALSQVPEWLRYLVIPGAIGALLGIWLAMTKVGHRIAESHTWEQDRFLGEGITRVTLTNLKDRSVPIFELVAVVGNVVVPLHKFNEPLVLKSYDSVQVDIPLVSQHRLGDKPYGFCGELDSRPNKARIYYSTIGKWKCCVPLGAAPIHSAIRGRLWRSRPPRVAFAYRVRGPGKGHSRNVVYVVTYMITDTFDHALIDAQGIIDWPWLPPCIDPAIMRDPQAVADYLMRAIPFKKLFVQKTPFWIQWFTEDRDALGDYGLPVFAMPAQSGEAEQEPATHERAQG